MKISKPPATFGSLCGIPVFIICISTFGMHPIFQTNKTASLQFCFGEEDNTVWIQVCFGGHSCVDMAESLLPSPCKLSWCTMVYKGFSWKFARHYSRTQCWQLKNKKQASKQKQWAHSRSCWPDLPPSGMHTVLSFYTDNCCLLSRL